MKPTKDLHLKRSLVKGQVNPVVQHKKPGINYSDNLIFPIDLPNIDLVFASPNSQRQKWQIIWKPIRYSAEWFSHENPPRWKKVHGLKGIRATRSYKILIWNHHLWHSKVLKFYNLLAIPNLPIVLNLWYWMKSNNAKHAVAL